MSFDLNWCAYNLYLLRELLFFLLRHSKTFKCLVSSNERLIFTSLHSHSSYQSFSTHHFTKKKNQQQNNVHLTEANHLAFEQDFWKKLLIYERIINRRSASSYGIYSKLFLFVMSIEHWMNDFIFLHFKHCIDHVDITVSNSYKIIFY